MIPESKGPEHLGLVVLYLYFPVVEKNTSMVAIFPVAFCDG